MSKVESGRRVEPQTLMPIAGCANIPKSSVSIFALIADPQVEMLHKAEAHIMLQDKEEGLGMTPH
jgi:hypothetical protein